MIHIRLFIFISAHIFHFKIENKNSSSQRFPHVLQRDMQHRNCLRIPTKNPPKPSTIPAIYLHQNDSGSSNDLLFHYFYYPAKPAEKKDIINIIIFIINGLIMFYCILFFCCFQFFTEISTTIFIQLNWVSMNIICYRLFFLLPIYHLIFASGKPR